MEVGLSRTCAPTSATGARFEFRTSTRDTRVRFQYTPDYLDSIESSNVRAQVYVGFFQNTARYRSKSLSRLVYVTLSKTKTLNSQSFGRRPAPWCATRDFSSRYVSSSPPASASPFMAGTNCNLRKRPNRLLKRPVEFRRAKQQQKSRSLRVSCWKGASVEETSRVREAAPLSPLTSARGRLASWGCGAWRRCRRPRAQDSRPARAPRATHLRFQRQICRIPVPSF